MISPHTNVLQLAAGAGNAFAATTGLDPTPVEAIEAHRRAKNYHQNAIWIGLGIGGAVGLSLLVLRRSRPA